MDANRTCESRAPYSYAISHSHAAKKWVVYRFYGGCRGADNMDPLRMVNTFDEALDEIKKLGQ